MEQAAKWHHAYWGPTKKGVSPVVFGFQSETIHSVFPKLAPKWRKAYPAKFEQLTSEKLPAIIMDAIDCYCDNAAAMSDPKNSWIQGGAKTVIHGDFRRDNLMWTQKPGQESPEIQFIDFQVMRWGHGEDDIAYFIFGSLADPEKDWKEVLRAYYAAVKKAHVGEAPYSWEECQFHLWCGVVNVALAINLVAVSTLDFAAGGNTEGTELIRSGTPKVATALELFDCRATIAAMLDEKTFQNGKFDTSVLAKCVKYEDFPEIA